MKKNKSILKKRNLKNIPKKLTKKEEANPKEDTSKKIRRRNK